MLGSHEGFDNTAEYSIALAVVHTQALATQIIVQVERGAAFQLYRRHQG
jgi:hypothetical protein